MVRIHSSRINQGPIGELPSERTFPLGKLPPELPPPSHNRPSAIDVAHLFLPAGTDLSRISTNHPLKTLFEGLLLKLTLGTLVSVAPPKLQ
jgi:hypothetical protein